MGAMQNNEQKPGKGNKSRGSVRNADRLQAFASGGESGQAEWATCSPELLHSVVAGITRVGGAVIFGLSKDRGAHSLTLMLGGKRQPLWYNGDADLDEELTAVVDMLAGMEE